MRSAPLLREGTFVPAHLLSVVMPTRNRPEWLERAARSVLDQRTAELELVIVDDGSSERHSGGGGAPGR